MIFCVFLTMWVFWSLQTTLLCIVVELAGEGCVAGTDKHGTTTILFTQTRFQPKQFDPQKELKLRQK